ncbi:MULTISPECIES: RloB family protein [unclassified Cupriavidus]|uniref:RloB family protein n=1 Tax=unclassified Cupriavidus TaxID=2640874 RepID=UPI00313BC123
MPRQLAQRKRVFVGCEGESERSYVTVLQRILGLNARHHLVTPVLNGGDPLAIVEAAIKALRQERQLARDAFVAKFILLDRDLLGRAPDRDQRIEKSAAEYGFRLIWQDPCHEALLLRHLENCHNMKPPTTVASERALLKEWPRYRKNMAAQELSEIIHAAALQRIARVEPALAELLQLIGL